MMILKMANQITPLICIQMSNPIQRYVAGLFLSFPEVLGVELI